MPECAYGPYRKFNPFIKWSKHLSSSIFCIARRSLAVPSYYLIHFCTLILLLYETNVLPLNIQIFQ